MDENSSCHGTYSSDTLATTQSKRKKPSERSEIWEHFTKYDPDEPTMEELEFYEAMISEFGSSATTEAMTLD
ncbi:hypothetical protein AB3S75_040579 [Citrus x aurantiifolia]